MDISPDDFNREYVWGEVDTSITSHRVVRVLDQLKELRGLPEMIRVDNGPEFVSGTLAAWCRANDVELAFIEPGKPTQNAYVERFNGTLRRELLNAHVFMTIKQVRIQLALWRKNYNEQRPHKALGGVPPIPFAKAALATAP